MKSLHTAIKLTTCVQIDWYNLYGRSYYRTEYWRDPSGLFRSGSRSACAHARACSGAITFRGEFRIRRWVPAVELRRRDHKIAKGVKPNEKYMYIYISSTVYVLERGRYVERSISSKFAPFPDWAKCIGTDLYDCCCCNDLSYPTCTAPPPTWLFEGTA
ncbi:hypothetical protein QTP88_013226 [Uroleucon formosanum]